MFNFFDVWYVNMIQLTNENAKGHVDKYSLSIHDDVAFVTEVSSGKKVTYYEFLGLPDETTKDEISKRIDVFLSCLQQGNMSGQGSGSEEGDRKKAIGLIKKVLLNSSEREIYDSLKLEYNPENIFSKKLGVFGWGVVECLLASVVFFVGVFSTKYIRAGKFNIPTFRLVVSLSSYLLIVKFENLVAQFFRGVSYIVERFNPEESEKNSDLENNTKSHFLGVGRIVISFAFQAIFVQYRYLGASSFLFDYILTSACDIYEKGKKFELSDAGDAVLSLCYYTPILLLMNNIIEAKFHKNPSPIYGALNIVCFSSLFMSSYHEIEWYKSDEFYTIHKLSKESDDVKKEIASRRNFHNAISFGTWFVFAALFRFVFPKDLDNRLCIISFFLATGVSSSIKTHDINRFKQIPEISA